MRYRNVTRHGTAQVRNVCRGVGVCMSHRVLSAGTRYDMGTARPCGVATLSSH